jgi:L-fuconate dehydratase
MRGPACICWANLTSFSLKVCIHAGGVGLCNMAAHLCAVDFISVSKSTHGKMAEYIDHLQEHFEVPLDSYVKDARYLAPTAPGYGCDMKARPACWPQLPPPHIFMERYIAMYR